MAPLAYHLCSCSCHTHERRSQSFPFSPACAPLAILPSLLFSCEAIHVFCSLPLPWCFLLVSALYLCSTPMQIFLSRLPDSCLCTPQSPMHCSGDGFQTQIRACRLILRTTQSWIITRNSVKSQHITLALYLPQNHRIPSCLQQRQLFCGWDLVHMFYLHHKPGLVKTAGDWQRSCSLCPPQRSFQRLFLSFPIFATSFTILKSPGGKGARVPYSQTKHWHIEKAYSSLIYILPKISRREGESFYL